jgi:hypothetical protein
LYRYSLAALLNWLDEFDHVKLQILTIETIANLCEDCETNRARLVELDGTGALQPFCNRPHSSSSHHCD